MNKKSYEVFLEKYKPVKNHIVKDACFEGLMFETYDEEVNFVCGQPNNKIWTFMCGENETSWLVAGYHLVDRMGYFISEVAWEDETEEYSIDDYISIDKAQEIGINFIQNNISVNSFVADELRSFIESKLTDEEQADNQINVNVAKYHVIDYLEDELGIDRDTFEDEIHDWWYQQY